jgi:microcystin-dependent protein
MSDFFIGQIMMCGFDFTPRYFAQCSGQLLAINQNQALFSLLGTQFGGNGVNTFALPDLRGRTPLSIGQSASSGGNYAIGQQGGAEFVTLTQQNMPTHQHQIQASSAVGNGRNPRNGLLATSPTSAVYGAPSGNSTLNSSTLAPAGGGQAHENRQPYLTLNFCIALSGIFPSRN